MMVIKIVSARELEWIEEQHKQQFFQALDALNVSGYEALKYMSWFTELNRAKVCIIKQPASWDDEAWN